MGISLTKPFLPSETCPNSFQKLSSLWHEQHATEADFYLSSNKLQIWLKPAWDWSNTWLWQNSVHNTRRGSNSFHDMKRTWLNLSCGLCWGFPNLQVSSPVITPASGPRYLSFMPAVWKQKRAWRTRQTRTWASTGNAQRACLKIRGCRFLAFTNSWSLLAWKAQ